jgi:hypothetical protein
LLVVLDKFKQDFEFVLSSGFVVVEPHKGDLICVLAIGADFGPEHGQSLLIKLVHIDVQFSSCYQCDRQYLLRCCRWLRLLTLVEDGAEDGTLLELARNGFAGQEVEGSFVA